MKTGGPFLWAHQGDQLPIGKAVAVTKAADELRIDAEFAGAAEQHGFAETVYRLFKAGFLRSVSVGLRVAEERTPTPEEAARGARWVASRADLLELSAVPVPADVGAVTLNAGRCLFTRADLAVAKAQFLYCPLEAIESRLRGYVAWFNGDRPHQGLDQRTPDEVFFAHDTRAKAVPLSAALTVDHLDGDRELPVLRLRRAA